MAKAKQPKIKQQQKTPSPPPEKINPKILKKENKQKQTNENKNK